MSEKKRTVAEIQQEYTSICTRAGHLQYQISALQEDLDTVNKTLRDLNFEGAAAKRAEQVALAEQDAQPSEEAKSE